MLLCIPRRFPSLLVLGVLLVLGEPYGRSAPAQTAAGKITQILEGIVAPHYSDGKWALSPDGKALALPYGRDWKFFPGEEPLVAPPVKRGIELWDLTAGKSRMLPNPRGKEDAVFIVAYSQSGRALAAVHGNGVTIWKVPGATESVVLPIRGGVWPVFIDADRTLLGWKSVSSGDKPGPLDYHFVIIRWDVQSGRRLSSVRFPEGQSLKGLSPDGRYGVIDDLRDESAGVYDVTTREKIFGLPTFSNDIFSTDGSVLVSCTKNRLSLLAVPSGKQLKHFDFVQPFGHPGHSELLSISADGKLLAVGEYPADQKATLISVESGKILGMVECGPRLTICDMLQLSADGRILVTSTCGVNTNDQPVEPWLKIWRLPEKW